MNTVLERSSGVGTLSEAPPRRLRLMIFRPNLADGGADRVTVTLLKYLDLRRFDPTLVLMRKEGQMLGHVPKAVRVLELGSRRLRGAWPALTRLVRAESPDVLVSTSSGGNLVVSLAQWLSGHRCRLVLSERTMFSMARKERIPWTVPIGAVKRFLYRRAHLVMAVSQGVADDLVQVLRLPRSLVRVVYNPIVDESLLDQAEQPLAHPWFEDGVPVVLAAGRLITQKDYPTLLEAFGQVRRSRPARLMILGEGVLRPALEALVKEMGMEQDVQLPGFVINPFPYMKRCTVFVLSSKFEGLPGVLIQAMACGAPVISTDCPSGPAEIIEPGRSGLLVPVGNADSLAREIEHLLADPQRRETLAREGQRRAHDFNVQTMVAQYEAALSGDEVRSP
jgi:glycosyltransferase involved in cell wall biosynthesis